MASAAIEALDVHSGCLHTEIKLTPEGPRVIEVNGRIGGGVPEMLYRAAGVKIVELTLQLALGESIVINGPGEPPSESATGSSSSRRPFQRPSPLSTGSMS